MKRNIKTIVYLIFGLILSVYLTFGVAGERYTIDEKDSVVYFTSVKKNYILEASKFKKVTGFMDKKSGHVKVNIDLASLITRIAIRDIRIKQLFFNTDQYPKVEITAKISQIELKRIHGVGRMTIPADVLFYKAKRKMNIEVLVTKTKRKIVVSSMLPIIIDAKKFGVPYENLAKLSATVGGIAISDKASAGFVLTFEDTK